MTAPATHTVRRVAFARVAAAALANAPSVVTALVPGGRRDADEYTARNPRRADERPGSFRINMRTGLWSDFATGDAGGDLIALAAYIEALPMREAAIRLAEGLGVDPWEAC